MALFCFSSKCVYAMFCWDFTVLVLCSSLTIVQGQVNGVAFSNQFLMKRRLAKRCAVLPTPA